MAWPRHKVLISWATPLSTGEVVLKVDVPHRRYPPQKGKESTYAAFSPTMVRPAGLSYRGGSGLAPESFGADSDRPRLGGVRRDRVFHYPLCG